jgi:cell wall-associated NlpC family hydrolase
VISFGTRRPVALLLVALAAVATVLVAASAAPADPSISSKRAEAQAVLEQVRALDSQLSQAIEAFNYANVELAELDTELRSNKRHLEVAASSLVAAQDHIAARLRALYIEGDSADAVEVILGAESLDDLINRIDMVQRVGAQDADVVKRVAKFRREVKERRGRLTSARARQAEVVAERGAQRQWIEGQLSERQRLLASVRDEVARLEAAEARRQAQIQAQARARLAAAAAARSAVRQVQDTIPVEEEITLSVAPPPSRYGGVVGIAMQYLGVPYVWGGASPSGFDCSGFIMYVYAQVGVQLPHHAASQFNQGVPVSRDQLQAGDLVFFDGLGHAGIYIGGGQFIHSPHTGDVVKISSLYDSWYSSTFVGARRVL